MMDRRPSPCLRCTRVPDPENCENKQCGQWKAWFLERWEQLRRDQRLRRELCKPVEVGVVIGGRHYAAPHEVRSYLAKDPCQQCLLPKALCTTACPERRAWEAHRREVFL